MTTVLKDGEAPRDNTHTTLLESNSQQLYGRPTAGGNIVSGTDIGGRGDAPAGAIPNNPIMGGIATTPPAGDLMSAAAAPDYPAVQVGANPSTGDTQAGPDMFHGATQVVADSGDRPSGGKADATGGGTVGDSGPQGGPFQSTVVEAP